MNFTFPCDMVYSASKITFLGWLFEPSFSGIFHVLCEDAQLVPRAFIGFPKDMIQWLFYKIEHGPKPIEVAII